MVVRYIYSKATITINNSKFIENKSVSTSKSASGGAIANYGTIKDILSSTFSKNSAKASGGAIYNAGEATISDSIFSENTAADGGAIYNVFNGTILTINDSTFEKNTATSETDTANGGAIFILSGTATINNSKFIENKSTSVSQNTYGGAITNFSTSNTKISGSTFSKNSTKTSGGAIYQGGKATISDSIFSENTATYGGAIYNSPNDTTVGTGILTINDSTFEKNTATSEINQARGGAISILDGTVTINNSKFIENKSTSVSQNTFGGAIVNLGTSNTKISGSTFSKNSAKNSGGAIYNAGEVTISDSTTFSENTATYGGVIYNLGIATFSDSTFSENTAAYGGAIYNDLAGKIAITNSKFINNKNTESKSSGFGSVIYNKGEATISNSEFSGNSAKTSGGVIYNEGTITNIANTTFSQNKATFGGAIYNAANTGVINLTDSNFISNTATNIAGAIYNLNSLTISTKNSNSEFTGNTASGVSNAITNKKNIYLNPSKGTQIIFNDAIDSNTTDNTTISINSTSSANGEVVFNNTVKNNTIDNQGKIILGTFEGGTFYGKEVAPSEGNFDDTVTLTMNSSGVIDTVNNAIKNDYRIGTLNSTNGRLALDVKFDGENDAKADMYTIGAGSGTINFDNINVFGQMPTTTKEVKIIDGAAAGDFTFGDFSAVTSDNVIKFTDSTTAGCIKYDIKENSQGLKTAVDLDVVNKNYQMLRDEIVTSDLGELKGSANRPFNINGNGYALIGNNKEGMTINANQSVVLKDISSIEGFKDNVAFTNNGEINMSNVVLNNKIQGLDTASVNLNSNNTLNSEIINNKVNLYGGVLNFGALADVSKASSFNVYSNPTLNLQNGAIQNTNFGNLVLNSDLNLNLDSNLATKEIDTISANSFSANNNNINIQNIKIFKPTTDKKFSLTPLGEISDTTLKNALASAIRYKGGEVAYSPIFKYSVEYDPKEALLNFSIAGEDDNNDNNSGGHATGRPKYQSLNPAVMASAVAAQIGGYLTQLNSYDEAFKNMDMYMLMTKKQRQAMKLRNKYASIAQGAVYDSPYSHYEDSSAWFRPYATFENVPLNKGPKVSNVAYGTFFGGDSELYELKHGWDVMWGAYGGYNGSHQAYDGVSIYQNGGTLGLSAFAYKDNFFTGLTANAGASVGSTSALLSNDDFTMLMAGVASKTGYNWELAEGKFIIQPSLLMSYSFVNTFDYTTDAGVHFKSDPLNAIQIEPGIKFIANTKSDWQPYLGVSMIWNILDRTHFKANDVVLPNLSIDPFVKYGVGVRKVWGDKFTGYFQTYITNGGRNGVGLQAGFSWLLGKKEKTNKEKLNNKTPELKKTEITLNNIDQ